MSIAPSQAAAFPSIQPSRSATPSADPTGSYNVRERAKCYSHDDDSAYFPGVVVIAYNVVHRDWIEVGRAVSDEEGYFTFHGLDSPTRDNRYIFVLEDCE